MHLIPFLTRIYRHFFAHSFCPPAMYLCASFRRHCRLYIPQFGYARENGAFRRFGISVPISISSSSQQSCHSCHQFHPLFIIHHSAPYQFIRSLSAVYRFIIIHVISFIIMHHHSSSSAASLHKLLSIFTALLTVMQRQFQCMHGMLRCVRFIGQTTTRLIGQTTAAKRVTVLWDTCVDPEVDR